MPLRIDAEAEPIPGYKLVSRLGSGGYGEVWKAVAPGGLHKAIKIVFGDIRTADDDGQHRAEQELKALQRVQSIRHPYLLSLERYDIVDGKLLIVTELADGNLMDKFKECRDQNMQGIPREELLRYLAEAAEVLDLMNVQHQLQHLDIKPQNLFLIHDHVKVADFGLVKDLEGMRTAMTGGVTPVYAAPETFEGAVTRFCDQYSLAIVFQELLTGHRPFTGQSVQQLVMQHLQGAPNLSSLPPTDRPIIAKALSKKPESRYPTCMAMVKALKTGSAEPAAKPAERTSTSAPTRTKGSVPVSSPTPVRGGGGPISEGLSRPTPRHAAPPVMRTDTPPTMAKIRREDLTPSPIAEPAPSRTAPPELTGKGALRPAVVVALGGVGLEALRQFKRSLVDRFGAMSRLPHIKLFYIDTDPDATIAAADGSPTLDNEEVLLCRLNRASHYLKPRRNGRSLIEGWFDAQMLYRIPRNPITQGVRALGRLAFGDFFRPIAQKIEDSIEAVTAPDALLQADQHTGLGVRTNRPRIYVLAGLGGGTGGGGFIDLAYTAKGRLHYMGYSQPDVVGVLLLPPVDRSTPSKALCTGNTYAALTELHHYCQPDTQFSSGFDDREGAVLDRSMPFMSVNLLPLKSDAIRGTPADGIGQAAEFLSRDVTGLFGRVTDELRTETLKAARGGPEVFVQTFGMMTLSWPRRAILERGSRRACQAVLERWTTKDAGPLRAGVQSWVGERWVSEELGPEHLIARLQAACERAIGQAPEPLFAKLAEPLTPKASGWRTPELNTMTGFDLMGRLDEIVGKPDENAMNRTSGMLGGALAGQSDGLIKEWGAKLAKLAVALMEEPDYRLAGAEEAIAQMRDAIERVLGHYTPLCEELSAKASQAYARIQALLNGEGNRRTAAADFAELVKHYPKWRYQSMLLKQVNTICAGLRSQMADQINEIGFCRQRLEELLGNFQSDERAGVTESAGYLLPGDCRNLDEAVAQVLSNVTEDDMRDLDRRIQSMVQSQFTALVHVCLSTSNLLANLEPAMLTLAQQFLESRIGEASVPNLFMERHPGGLAAKAIAQIYDEAAPHLGDLVPAPGPEFVVLAVPPCPASEKLADLARKAIDPEPLTLTTSPDDVCIYRELPRLPFARLPHLGAPAKEAYGQMKEMDHFTPHTRTDVEEWRGVG